MLGCVPGVVVGVAAGSFLGLEQLCGPERQLGDTELLVWAQFTYCAEEGVEALLEAAEAAAIFD